MDCSAKAKKQFADQKRLFSLILEWSATTKCSVAKDKIDYRLDFFWRLFKNE